MVAMILHFRVTSGFPQARRDDGGNEDGSRCREDAVDHLVRSTDEDGFWEACTRCLCSYRAMPQRWRDRNAGACRRVPDSAIRVSRVRLDKKEEGHCV